MKWVLGRRSSYKLCLMWLGRPSISFFSLELPLCQGDNRPFDMLWPGLLGQTKYEFAKTYCSVKYIKGRQGGKVFQDFSEGTRLEELNVLLKQSIMIRRLKEHVLLQLPPKRRQIIKLVLRKSDINSAMVALGLENVDATSESDAENAPLHVSDDGQDCDMNEKLSKKLSALGLAKLSGFFEWLSIHPIMVEVDGDETRQESSSSHKMIIFAYHHKVLDGVQADDRAHRHGQKRVVNVYIFCAEDTSDELQWQQLNRSLLRVSSTVNGKQHAIPELEVEGVSYLESTSNTSDESKHSIELQNACVEPEPVLPKASSDMHVEADNGRTEDHESGKTSNGDGHVNKVECTVKTYIQPTTLRFEVSQHTGRIHLYSCTPGINCRPSPLFKSFWQEEVECWPLAEEQEKSSGKSVEDDSIYMEALMSFNNEWKELRPIEKRRLINKPLQLPLSCELCYLNESLNHETGGLMRGGSSRRKTPLAEICISIPSNAAWTEVNLCSDHGQKTKIYKQAWSDMDEPLCKLCQNPCMGSNAKGLFQIERGICTTCQLDCHRLVQHLRVLSVEKREAYIKNVAPNIAKRKKMLAKLVQDPTEGNAWHADHITPVYKGGGKCKLENMRTLCIACHGDVTTAQCAERRIARRKAKKQLKETMSVLITRENQTTVLKKCDEDYAILDDDLLIDIPGSAYSGPEVIAQSSSRRICSVSGDDQRVFDGERSCQELGNPSDLVDSDSNSKNIERVTVTRSSELIS